jgi:hypothetical protein
MRRRDYARNRQPLVRPDAGRPCEPPAQRRQRGIGENGLVPLAGLVCAHNALI